MQSLSVDLRQRLPGGGGSAARDAGLRGVIDQTVSCYRVAGPTGVAMLLLAIWTLLLAQPAPSWTFAWFALMFLLGLGFIGAWYAVQRIVISRAHLPVWRGLILALAATSVSGWSLWHAQSVLAPGAVMSPWYMLVGLIGLALISALVAAWPLALLIVPTVYVAAGGLYLAQHDAGSGAVHLLAGAVPILVVALLVGRFLRRFDHAKAQAGLARAELARTQAQLSDRDAQMGYEVQRRQEAERELAQTRELADAANRAKTEFLATMSHEIRTPLNGILPILEMLRDTGLDHEQNQLVGTAFNSSRHLLRIINDILDFAKAESGKLELENIEIDLRELAGSVTDLMARSAAKRSLKLTVDVDDKVPGRVRGDPIRLRQILTNLVSNAIKFTDEGGIRIEVSRLRVSRKEVELLFTVSDTGIGMSRETARQLFQSFTQADASTTRKHGGTGLGLVICRRLVELMGGKIGVRSRQGAGSSFWFVLPMRKSVTEVPSARRDLVGVRVLTLIADPEMAGRVSANLTAWGMSEERASSETDAISKLQSSAMLGRSWVYEVFLLDNSAPESRLRRLLQELSGVATLEGLRILVAGRSERDSEALIDDYGVYVLKDIHRQEPLRRLLHRLLDVEGSDSPGREAGQRQAYRDLNVELADPQEEQLPDLEIRPEKMDGGFRGRVLLVEDNPVNLSVVRKVLSRLGVECGTAHNGQEALDMAEREHYDLIYMDCQMPVMDGYEATHRLREMEAAGAPHVPIVAMTANAMAGDRETCIAAGMDDYLAKPVNMAQLAENLGRWLTPMGHVPWQSTAPARPAAAIARPASDAVLDRATLDELREVMEDEFLRLIRTYLENAPGLRGALDEAAGSRDAAAMVVPAHSLKSSSANVGAVRLSELARRIEFACREERLDQALAAHAELGALFDRTRDALRAML